MICRVHHLSSNDNILCFKAVPVKKVLFKYRAICLWVSQNIYFDLRGGGGAGGYGKNQFMITLYLILIKEGGVGPKKHFWSQGVKVWRGPKYDHAMLEQPLEVSVIHSSITNCVYSSSSCNDLTTELWLWIFLTPSLVYLHQLFFLNFEEMCTVSHVNKSLLNMFLK